MLERLSKHRNYLHTIPELALEEYETAHYIRENLKKLNLEYIEVGTSTLCFIQGEENETIGYRADIDGLPLKENTNNLYRSQKKNQMHGCGHDGHMAILLTFIEEVVKEIKNGKKLKKSLLFVFQAGEESAGGARYIVKNDFYKSKNVKEIYALHVYPEINKNEFAIKKGCVSLQNINLDIRLQGKGCHGAQPHKGIDSILIGAKLVEAYQSLKSRNIPSNENFILTIGSFKGGEVRNVIPEYIDILGSIRLENTELIPFVKERLEEINKGFEIAFGVKIEMEFRPFYPPVFNDEKLVEMSIKYLGDYKVYEDIPLSGSEDFSFYLEDGTPGVLGLLGIKEEDKGYIYPLHNEKFDFNNSSLIPGVEFFKRILEFRDILY
ncbi:MAG: M20 family metallopeptidase [Cetobacterium sp.]|nr:M20 family metallopeptidase [Cetobacterium sp.]